MNRTGPRPDFTPEEEKLLRQLRPGTHPLPNLLRAATENVLPEQIKAEIEKHVSQCATCSVLQADLSDLEPEEPTLDQRRRIRSKLPTGPTPATQARRFIPWRPLVAAGAIAFIVLVGVVILRRPHPAPVTRQAAARPAASPKLARLDIIKAPIKIPAALIPTRGARRTDLPELREWTLALKPYQRNDFALAVTELTAIAKKYPQFADAYFYMGVSQLMLSRNEDAARNLEMAGRLASGTRLLQVKWFLAAADARLGHKLEAINEWRAICDAGSAHAKEACAEIKRLQSAGGK